MMRLPPFRYVGPSNVSEAAALLADHGPTASLLAGGTDLFPSMKRGQHEPRLLVGLRRVTELQGASGDEQSGVTLGAGLSLNQVASTPGLGGAFRALALAAGSVSTPHLRSMGTLGGNLCLDTRCNYYNQPYWWRAAINFCKKKDGDVCWVAPASARCWAVSSSDCAPAAVALGASVRLVSARGERVIPAADLFRDDGIDYLRRERDEILTDVLLPPALGLRSTYLKLRRRGSFDFPILGVAAALWMDGGVVRDARLVLGAVGSSPTLADAASQLLVGEIPTPDLIDRVADAAWRDARPLDNTDLNYAWRKRMARVFTRRALRQLVGLPSGPTSAHEVEA